MTPRGEQNTQPASAPHLLNPRRVLELLFSPLLVHRPEACWQRRQNNIVIHAELLVVIHRAERGEKGKSCLRRPRPHHTRLDN